MNIKIEHKGYELKILIDELPHLIIKDRIIGFQAWNNENSLYEVEFYTKHKNIVVQYDSELKWKLLLTELNKIF